MRYFAMIDGERRGPLELDQLVAAGVRPDTYVWCKGMDDWQQARYVADICRQMRRTLAGIDTPRPSHADTPQPDNPFAGPTAGGTLSPRDSQQQQPADSDRPDDKLPPPTRFSRYLNSDELPSLEEAEEKPDLSKKPPSLLLASIILTLICFPPTGLIAVYNSVLTGRLWRQALMQTDPTAADSYRRMAWDYSRRTKMWLGITLFMGLIVWAFLGRFFI